MKVSKLIQKFEKKYLKKQIPALSVGNQVQVGLLVKEVDKERIQFFNGIIISINQASINTTITVRRIFQGIGVERTFPIYSFQIKSIKVLKDLKSKRSKLFYLRNKIGRAATQI